MTHPADAAQSTAVPAGVAEPAGVAVPAGVAEPGEDGEVAVRDAPERNRFEIWVGDVLAGFTVYRAQADHYTFVHTEIDPAFGGRGLAAVLIKHALDEMRAREMAVLPQCPFVRRYISRHTEYLDLVPADNRAEFDLPASVDAAGP